MKKSTLKALIQAVLTECKTCGCGLKESGDAKWLRTGDQRIWYTFEPGTERSLQLFRYRVEHNGEPIPGTKIVYLYNERDAAELIKYWNRSSVWKYTLLSEPEAKDYATKSVNDRHLPENWVAKGSEKNFTPSQQAAVAKATAKGFKLISTRPEGGQTVGVLAIRIGGNVMEIEVFPNGLIRKTVGEEMTTRAELDTGLMKAVNVEDEEVVKEMTSTGAVAGYSAPFAFTKNKKGSSRAMAVSKKMGFKPTGIEDKRNH